MFGLAASTTPDPEKQQRNPEALYLQASMKLWQGAVKKGQPEQKLCEQYGEQELIFLESVLRVLLALAESSCNSWNSDILRQLEEQVLQSCDWEDDESGPDVGDATNYKFVRTVGEAFHDSHRSDKHRTERKSKVRFAWDDESQNSRNKTLDTSKNHYRVKSGSHSSNYVMKSDSVAHKNVNNNASSIHKTGDKSRTGENESEPRLDSERMRKAQLVVRKGLVRSGICETVAGWVVCGHQEIEVTA